jgi:tripartite-type tricarboxylate transporter receptor subunit TctC
MPANRARLGMLVLGSALVCAGPAFAQSISAKVIRILTAQVGSGNDLVARLIAQSAAAKLGQQIIVDNRGIIAVELTAKAPPDGTTVVLYGTPLWLLSYMRENVAWDVMRDFAPVTWATNAPNVLVVNASVPARSVKELIALAKAKPGQINYGSGSAGSTSHLAAELFKSMASVDLVRVPYKGGGLALNALVSGEIEVTFPSANAAAAHLNSGKLVALAVGSLQPSSLVPGLPTLAASGLPGFESSSNLGIFAPAKTPPGVIARLSHEMARALQTPELRDRLFSTGVEAVGSTPEQLSAMIKSEMSRLGKLIKDVGIRER